MIEESRNDKVEKEIKNYLEGEKEDLGKEDFSDKPRKNKKKLIVAAVAILLAILAFAYFSYTKGHKSFDTEKVKVSIDMPDETGSGDETSITINCKNDNKVDLTDAKLEMDFPDNFIVKSSDQKIEQSGSAYYWNVGNISTESTQKIRIYGKVIGKMGEDKAFKAAMSYKPSNFNSNFRAEGEKSIKISSVPVELNLNFPESIKDSSESELTFNYKNKSDRDFGKVRLEAEFPKDFIYASSDPNMTKKDGGENMFVLEEDNFAKGAEKSVKVKGSFQSQNDKETIKARIYLLEENNQMTEYTEEEKDIKMEKTDILLAQTVNGASDYSANKDEELTYKITFKNQSAKELRGLVLKSELAGNFDLTSLKADKGTVKNNTIVWSALNVPELASLSAGSEGSVEFKVKVQDRFTIEKETDKNFVLKNSASVSSFNSNSAGTQEKIIAKNEMDTKVKSFLFLDTKGYFNDDGRINNGGALPPKVGEKTYYTIHWSIRNFFNDTENVRVTSVLPEGVKWTGKYIDSHNKVFYNDESANTGAQPTDANGTDAGKISEERIFYNSKTNEVTWEIPALKANEGILTPAEEVVFQVEATPQQKNAGAAMTIIDNTKVSGYDSFVQGNVNNTGKAVTTELSDDYSISDREAIVKE